VLFFRPTIHFSLRSVRHQLHVEAASCFGSAATMTSNPTTLPLHQDDLGMIILCQSRPAVYLLHQRRLGLQLHVVVGAMSELGLLRGYHLFCREDGSSRLVQSTGDQLSPRRSPQCGIWRSCIYIVFGSSTLQSCRCSHFCFSWHYLTKAGILSLYCALGSFVIVETYGPVLRKVYLNTNNEIHGCRMYISVYYSLYYGSH